MAIVTPICCIIPKVFFDFYIYFSTNVGNEAFELPLPTWWDETLNTWLACISVNIFPLNFNFKVSIQLEKPVGLFDRSHSAIYHSYGGFLVWRWCHISWSRVVFIFSSCNQRHQDSSKINQWTRNFSRKSTVDFVTPFRLYSISCWTETVIHFEIKY